MSNFLLKNPDCVFIHIPKTGGSTIRKGIWSERYEGPVFGHIPDAWGSFYKFAFVRNPLDRLISAWSDFQQLRSPQEKSLREFFNIVKDNDIDYGESRRTRAERIRHHAIPQMHPFNCLQYADDLFRYEEYELSLTRLAKKLDFSIQDLPRFRATQHGPWEEYLHGDLLGEVIDFYRDDFKHLEYQIPKV